MKRTALLLASASLAACQVTSRHAPSTRLGQPSTAAAMAARLDQPGPVIVERVVAADWAVPLSGLLDLEAPAARAAGLEDRDEPIQIYMYVIRHPERGTYVVDSGISQAIADGDLDVFSWAVKQAMPMDQFRVKRSTKAWLETEPEPVKGVFLTHLHMDHILGVVDFPDDTPVYVGPGEAHGSRFVNMFVQGTTDRALAGHEVRSLQMTPDPDGAFTAVQDVFGDGSFFAVHTPGHTAGHLAFVARTPDGPVLMTGDASHTAWGFEHGVPPGTYTDDSDQGDAALVALRGLAEAHPSMRIFPGHQRFEDPRAKVVLHLEGRESAALTSGR